MEEILSPRQRLPRIQSPTSAFFLGSNDDKLERAQARAARAAAIRRKSIAAHAQPLPTDNPDLCLEKQQILDLFHNCIKLASENKINQKNTWELNLIDHLCEIIKVEEENDSETNFQKASCTLEAGVKIYSLRVDSVHSEAYKVLGGINRAGHEDERGTVEDANIDNGEEEGHSKKVTEKKLSPLSTLEPSFEALNVKKFDVSFAVDPLYHQTSAQFDEGGAKGLLLNNLGVYGGCRVLFDSLEVPGKGIPCELQCEGLDTIDLSFARDCIEQMVLNMQIKNEISPTLRYIVDKFDEDNQRPLNTFYSHQTSDDQVDKDDRAYDNEVEFDGETYENCGPWNVDQDDHKSAIDEDHIGADTTFPSYHEERESFFFDGPDVDDRFHKVDEYLFFSMDFTSKRNDWAGPDHWKYRKVKGSEDHYTTDKGSLETAKRSKTKKKAELNIDFTKAWDDGMAQVFAPPKNPKSLLLPATRLECNTRLPEDCHYQPEDLVKLFLLPNMMCLGKRRKMLPDDTRQNSDDHGALPSWDGESVFAGQFDNEDAYSDLEDTQNLVSKPHQVNQIEVHYDKTSKQVDVQKLKETLWHHIQESTQMTVQDQEEAVSFRDLLASFPSQCSGAASIKDISPHLCFICLLHLANEQGLSIRGRASLDDLNIHLPSQLV